MKIKVLTQSGTTEWSKIIFPISSGNKQTYCDLHGYELIKEQMTVESTPDVFNEYKYLNIEKHLNDCDYLFWMDNIFVVMNPEIKLESLVETDSDIICSNMIWNLAPPRDTEYKIFYLSFNFLIKNSKWSHEVFFPELARLKIEMKAKQGDKKINYWVDDAAWIKMHDSCPYNFLVLPTKRLFSNCGTLDVPVCRSRYEPEDFLMVYSPQMPMDRVVYWFRQFEEKTRQYNYLPPLGLSTEFLQSIGALS